MAYDDRLKLLKQTTGIRDSDVQDYERTEILRKTIQDIRTTATQYQVVRTSPKKLYSNVKSKVAGNIKSIKKSQSKQLLSSTKRRVDTENMESQTEY